MPRVRNRAFVSRGGTRRQTQWIPSTAETAFTAVAAAGNDLQGVLNAAALALTPFTVVRVVGQLFITSDQVADLQETPFGAAGLAVVTTKASAAGGVSIPLPATDAGSDVWFAHQWAAVGASQGTTTVGIVQAFAFESRAMRKVEDGFDIVSVFENASAVDGIGYLLKYRMLIKLH